MEERLRAAWLRLVDPLDPPPGAADAVLNVLEQRWSEPHRAYHGMAHLRHVLATLDMLLASGEQADDATEVRFAAWFHDAVYRPGDVGNERASAELAAAELPLLGVAPEPVARVVAMVLATEEHRAEGGDARLLVDADLAILAAAPGPYDLYRRGVRVEYGFLDDEQWREGRAAFVRDMLARPRIYATSTLHDRGEEAARRNLHGELAELTGGP